MSDENEKSSWLQPLPEEYTDEGDMTGRRMFVAALTVIILAIFGGLIWYSYMEGASNGPVPVVRADNSVIKVKPENPGGMEVLNQDKNVFNRVTSGETEHDESLGASAELPLDRPKIKTPEIKMTEKIVDTTIVASPKENNQDENLVVKPESVAQSVAAIAPSVKGGTDGFLVQLGAFGKKETAEQLWEKLKNDNPALLSGLSPDVMMIDLGKKGVLYRLRGGLVTSREQADNICAGLKTKKQACIVMVK
ncbi:MAG: SPOR domain-containing protein [Emcibacter sp.]|nr:SPOR domain-containing protein [Emcibacter sp.]